MIKSAGVTVAALMLCFACAWATTGQEPFMFLHAKLADADTVFAGQVVADEMVVPSAPGYEGAHRVVTLRPLLGLKGKVPQTLVEIPHSSAFPLVDDVQGRTYTWMRGHEREIFQIGGVYFVFANEEGASLVFRHAVESDIRLDDPAGATRGEIEAAAGKAGLSLPQGWSHRLDAAVRSDMSAAMGRFARPGPGADAVVVVSVQSARVRKLRREVDAFALPKDLHNELLLSPENGALRRLASRWHGMAIQGVAWADEDLPLLGALRGAGGGRGEIHTLDVAGEIIEVIPLGAQGQRRRGRITIGAAAGFDEGSLAEAARLFDTDGGRLTAYFPVCDLGAPEGEAIRACGRPQIAPEQDVAVSAEPYRRLGRVSTEIALLDGLLNAAVLPPADRFESASAVLGRSFARDDAGWAALKEAWLAARGTHLARIERIAAEAAGR